MDFYSNMQALLDKYTLTENGAVAYRSTESSLLDFNFLVSQLRNMPDEMVASKYGEVYEENRYYAIIFLFYLRDCREGMGERRSFRICLQWLAEKEPDLVSGKEFMSLIPFYGRWDDLLVLLDTSLAEETAGFINQQISQDLSNGEKGKPVSLLGKWMPSENASSERTRELARRLQSLMGYSPRIYRKIVTTLRMRIKLVETQMSAGEWEQIDYSAVPSKANLVYKNAFMRHDRVRRLEYLESLKNGEAKINAKVLSPYEIVRSYRNFNSYILRTYDETLEELWRSLPDLAVENTLVVRDGSASMFFSDNGLPIDVATALAVYTAEHNNSCWKDKFITFSAIPKLVDLSHSESLKEKLEVCRNENDCSNTNIEKTMMLILNIAVKNNCKQEDIPRVLIISDMQFDGCVCDTALSRSYTLFEEIRKKFEEAGYKLPKIVFWNVAADKNNGIPLRENELGVILCSGFSVQLLNMVMSSETDPLKALLDVLDSDRYGSVRSVLDSNT